MHELKYIIEDSTIAELLGRQNFNNDESAVLELVKNAYDAKALKVTLKFTSKSLTISDDGVGMNTRCIKNNWMHVGKSEKGYETIDKNNRKRVLAGSKGIGRFALSRLGESVSISSKMEGSIGVIWRTDWNNSSVYEEPSMETVGTIIVIDNLREKWGKKKVINLIDFLEKTYNDNSMIIEVDHQDISKEIKKKFSQPKLGSNCLSFISISYDKNNKKLVTNVKSDEFSDEALKYTGSINLKEYTNVKDILSELKNSPDLDLTSEELENHLFKLGNFTSELYFNINSSQVDMGKFLYKYSSVPQGMESGIVLYRNAFSISAYEGKKDWLGLGKRSRKSPAAASHPTGAWRVRENQLTGKVEIDKKENFMLQDLSNRQGLDENTYYKLFIEIICIGLKEFERYRQTIIRLIDKKNNDEESNNTRMITDRVLTNPNIVTKLSNDELQQLAIELKSYKKGETKHKKEKADVEKRYKYDVRILNVLATAGLKASSIAHEMKNDRNSIAKNSINIVEALKEYNMWDDLNHPDLTLRAYKNVPYLIRSNSEISEKLVSFMDTMLTEIEKKQFEIRELNIFSVLNNLKSIWQRDYAWISIELEVDNSIYFELSEDIIKVVLDNLILNSIQQNDDRQLLNIDISILKQNDKLLFRYKDDGKGLDEKYLTNKRLILEVHETTRKDGHGLGMWIVNNSIVMSGGEILKIDGERGFGVEFTIGGKV